MPSTGFSGRMAHALGAGPGADALRQQRFLIPDDRPVPGCHRTQPGRRRTARSEERFRLLVEGIADYAILCWTRKGSSQLEQRSGADQGIRAEEIIGQHYSCFYGDEDLRKGKPAMALRKRQPRAGSKKTAGGSVKRIALPGQRDTHRVARPKGS